ncbi:signal peptide peptidase SppA [Marinobacterium sp. 3-1745]|uniref:Signal peptide peptidase SppA n=2 Tax=Marinobacterium marinum TaxID=2756129 RepID=A0A7W1WY65_9GAMM|nr:signal peptide peptidase SppA [Marinobacterium marinum]MBA4502251.1 signal peptide peptidase SppA [Marinobacterium marinum]
MLGSLQVEQRRSRRWGIFFKLLTFVYLFSLLGMFFIGKDLGGSKVVAADHTAIVEVKGPIMDGEDASADTIIAALRDAFEAEHSKAVVLRINSPGGSPVQSGYVYDEIKRLRELNPEKKVYAVITDIGASGAYYIAAAADEIYADKASLVGSIGVISSSFGFVDLIEKLGVERRTLTAGENKAFLDPFSPLKERDREFWQTVLNTTHQQFIEQVRKGRGDRLKGGDELFTGLVWSGEQALELGLVDGLGSSSMVAREVIGAEKLVDYTARPQPLDRLIERLGVGVAKELALQMGLRSDYSLR